MKILDLQALSTLFMALLLSLLPIHSIIAQGKTDVGQKQMRVKMFKNINGEVQVIDTVLNAEDYAKALSSLKGFKADTAILRRLNKSLRGNFRVDSTRAIYFENKNFKGGSALFRRFDGKKLRAYTFDSNLSAEDRNKMFERLKATRSDTADFRRLGTSRVYIAGGDSLRGKVFKREILSGKGDTIRFETLVPGRAIKLPADSAHIIRLGKANEMLKGIMPADIREITVHRSGTHIMHLDSLTPLSAAGHRLKFLKDGESGRHHIYIVEQDGNSREVSMDSLKLYNGERKIIIMLKTEVLDVTAEDKKNLKAAGNKVEAKKKETLEIEDVNFYPNPNNGRFTLKFTLERKGDAVIRIMNSTGKEIYTETVKDLIGQYDKQIDISDLGTGIYYLQVVQSDRYATRKILVQ